MQKESASAAAEAEAEAESTGLEGVAQRKGKAKQCQWGV